MTGPEAFAFLARAVPLPLAGLEALALALRADSRELLGPHPDRPLEAGLETWPPHPERNPTLAVEAASPLAFCGWKGARLGNLASVNIWLTAAVLGPETRDAAVAFAGWWERTPHAEGRPALLAAVEKAVEARKAAAA